MDDHWSGNKPIIHCSRARQRCKCRVCGWGGQDEDGIWWGKGNPKPGGSGLRKMLIAGHYKFYVSLENTILEDYVTEKFYEGFMTDTVMVYLGAPNAERYAPAPHSFVNALDFEGPAALAGFLTGLAGDEARYGAYQAWKRERPVRVREEFAASMRQDLVNLDGNSMLCRLCGLVSSGVAGSAAGGGAAGAVGSMPGQGTEGVSRGAGGSGAASGSKDDSGQGSGDKVEAAGGPGVPEAGREKRVLSGDADEGGGGRGPGLCEAKPGLCEYGKGVKERLRGRRAFVSPVRGKANVSMHVDGSLTGWFGAAPWLSGPALAECQWSCSVTEDAGTADVVVSNLRPAGERRAGRVYAAVNMEAHSLDVPTDASNVVLMSVNQESEVVVNYAYSVMHSLGVCVGDAKGVRPNGQRCENMRARDSAFYRWCAAGYGGDFFTCVFHVVPHVLRSAPAADKAAGALGVAWMSASCERHGNYLGELMQRLRIDSMGGCYHNRDEDGHPALSAEVRDEWVITADTAMWPRSACRIWWLSLLALFPLPCGISCVQAKGW